MLLQRYVRNQKSQERRSFINLVKPHFGPILAPFGLKNSKQSFSHKNHLSQF